MSMWRNLQLLPLRGPRNSSDRPQSISQRIDFRGTRRSGGQTSLKRAGNKLARKLAKHEIAQIQLEMADKVEGHIVDLNLRTFYPLREMEVYPDIDDIFYEA